MTICKFLINKHTNICVDVCRNGSCQGDQTMLGAWQSERENLEEKTLPLIALSFSARPSKTSLYGAMTASMSLLQPYTQGAFYL